MGSGWSRSGLASVLAFVAMAGSAQAEKIPGGHSQTLFNVKFADGTDVRLRGGELTSLSGADLSEVETVLAGYPGLEIDRTFTGLSQSELAADVKQIDRKTTRYQPDLNLFYRLTTPAPIDGAELLADLDALDVVEEAFPEGLPAPPPATPDFSGLQRYSNAAPQGVDADAVQAQPGANGSNVRIIDIEYAWNVNHEDLSKARLPGASVPQGTPVNPFPDNHHGTAVLGMLVGDDNGFGVTGLVPGASIGMTNQYTSGGQNVAGAVNTARAALSPGDVILLEAQTVGANGGCGMSQVGCVPVEWNFATYSAIVSAVNDGIIVVEAAGNGSQNLDSPEHGSPFPAGRADSGAIIVGAAGNYCSATPHGRNSSSDHGARVDLHGFGNCLVSTGYGHLLDEAGINQDYTDQFSGTSGASPQVTAAAASLSSLAQQQGDADGLNSREARSLLEIGATPQLLGGGALTGNIGPMPNLAAAVSVYAPTVSAGGPYAAAEGTTIGLTASGSDPQGDGVSYAWDLNGDGLFDDASGPTPSVNVGADGVRNIYVKGTDSAGGFGVAAATLSVPNDADPPETKVKGPKSKLKLKGKKKKVKATWKLSSSEGGQIFCDLGKGDAAPCASPFKAKLKKGRHEFLAYAVDPAGNVDPTPFIQTISVKKKRR